MNPQSLNRYAYVLNNPMRWTDPSGHTIYLSHDDAALLADAFSNLAYQLTYRKDAFATGKDLLDFVALGLSVFAKSTLIGIATGIVGELSGAIGDIDKDRIIKFYELDKIIKLQNGVEGVALGGGANTRYGYDLFVLNRADNTKIERVELGYFLYGAMFKGHTELDIGWAFGDPIENGTYAFTDDMDGQYLGSPLTRMSCGGCKWLLISCSEDIIGFVV